MKHLRRLPFLLRAVPVSALAAGAIAAMPADSANAATYYINSNLPACKNADGPPSNNTGTTPEDAWCDFTQINRTPLGPGDRVLLAKGARWNQRLSLTGAGSDTQPIEVAAYGNGKGRPAIGYNSMTEKVNGKDVQREIAVRLTNPSNFVLRDLEVDGKDETGTKKLATGISAYYSETGKRNLRIENIYVHRNRIGLLIEGASALPEDQPALTGLRVTRVRGEHNEQSVVTTRYGRTPSRIFIKDAVFSGLVLSEDDGKIGDTDPAGKRSCPNSLQLTHLTDATVLNSLVSKAGGCPVKTGTTGVHVAHATDVRIVNNIIVDTQDTASPDMTGLNYEGWTTNVSVVGNYVGSTAGPGIEVLGNHADGPNTDAIVASNVVVDYGKSAARSKAKSSAFFSEGSRRGSSIPTGAFNDNVYDGSFTNQPLLTNFDKFGKSNNCRTTEDRVWFAAKDFGSEQEVQNWIYESSDNGRFTPLNYVSGAKRWQSDGTNAPPRIDAWNMQPGGGTSLVARSWVAPKPGVVTIRGYAVSYMGGDGAGVQVVHESKKPDGTASTTVEFPRQLITPGPDHGVSTTVRRLEVAAGDKVHFLVDAGDAGDNSNDVVSWTPSVAYIDGATSCGSD